MGPIPDNRRADAGRQLRVRLFGLAAVALVAFMFLAPPLAAWASLASEIKTLPTDTSPKEACAVLIKNKVIKDAREGECRKLIGEGFDAAKRQTDEGRVTIASATACAIQVFEKKLKAAQMSTCSEKVAKKIAPKDDDDGGGGFDPLGAAGDVAGTLGDGVDTITGAIGGAVTGTILDGFKAIIGLLFGGLQSAITVALIKWITRIPNLTDGHVGNLEASIAIGAGGLLAATMTISIVRFWGSGLTGDGAWAGAEGIARGVVAAILIGLWPQIFDLAIRFSNGLQAGILGDGVQAQLKDLFRDLDVIGLSTGAMTGGAVPMFLAIVIAIVGILMLLALVVMKIVLTALTIVLFCAMPLAFVLWPIPELAGIARICLRSLMMVLAIPIVWCLIFGAFAAIGADTFSFENTGKEEGIFGTALNVTIVRPLVAISLLYLALVMPRRLLQLAPFTGGGGASFGRSLATGATLRAGFSYGPQVGKAALGRAQALSAVGSAAGGGSGGGGPSPTGGGGGQSSGPGKAPGAGAGKESKKSPAAGLRDSTSQAAKAGQGRAKDSQNAAGETRDSAAQSAKARTSAAKGQGAASAPGVRLGGKFNGPETPNSSPEHDEAIASVRKDMTAASKSGSAVSDSQVKGAVGDLKGQPAFAQAAQNAVSQGSPKEATGAFAEWSVSKNGAVTDQHRSAFSVLGHASPQQRESAFGLDGGGGGDKGGGGVSGSGGSASPRPVSSSGNASNGGGRLVPKREAGSGSTPRPRLPHARPGKGGLGIS